MFVDSNRTKKVGVDLMELVNVNLDSYYDYLINGTLLKGLDLVVLYGYDILLSMYVTIWPYLFEFEIVRLEPFWICTNCDRIPMEWGIDRSNYLIVYPS